MVKKLRVCRYDGFYGIAYADSYRLIEIQSTRKAIKKSASKKEIENLFIEVEPILSYNKIRGLKEIDFKFYKWYKKRKEKFNHESWSVLDIVEKYFSKNKYRIAKICRHK